MGGGRMIVLNKRFYSSQRMLVLSFVLLIVLPVLLLSALYYAYAMDTVTEATERSYHEIVTQLGNTLEKDIHLLQANLDSLALNDTILRALSQGDFSARTSGTTNAFLQIDRVISDVLSSNPSLYTVLLLDRNQGVYHYRRMLYASQADLLQTEWYRQALARRGGTYWDGTWYNDNILTDPVSLFGASRAVIDKTTYETVGILYLAIRESAFSYLTDAQTGDEPVYVTDDGGRVLLTNRRRGSEGWRTAVDVSAFSPSAAGSIETEGDGTHTLTVYSKPLQNGWRVIKHVSLQGRLGEIAALRARILTIVALCFAAFGVFLYVTFKRITQPLQYMVNLVNEIDSAADGLDIASLPCYELIRISESMLSLVEKNRTTADELRFTRAKSEQNELSMLQAQLNPHFIYNTLGMIKSMLLEQNQPEIAAVMTAFIKLLRSSMSRDGMYVTLAQEMENIRHYLLIQRSLYGHTLQFDVSTQADCMDCMVPNFLLQPLVENAIYHGVDPMSEGARIALSAKQAGGRLTLCVEDNGVGMSEEMLLALRQAEHGKANDQKASPFGLLALDRKLFLLYGGDYAFLIDPVVPHGTRITLVLPATGGAT